MVEESIYFVFFLFNDTASWVMKLVLIAVPVLMSYSPMYPPDPDCGALEMKRWVPEMAMPVAPDNPVMKLELRVAPVVASYKPTTSELSRPLA